MKRFDGTFRWYNFRWYNSELIKRIKTLLLPYFIFCTLGILLCRSYPYKTLLDDYGITSLVTVVGALWYVRTLFVLCILSPLLILVVMAFTHFKTLRDIFLFALPFLLILRLPCQSSVVAPIIYFTFGLFLSRYGTCFANVTAKRKITWACILAGLLMIAKISYTFNSPEAEPILRKAMIPEYLIIIWYGYDLLYNNIPKFRKHSESIPEIILNATFFIYCMELFLRMFWQRALFAPLRIQTILNSPIGPFILTLLVVSSGMMLAKFLDRFAPKLYAILSGGRG